MVPCRAETKYSMYVELLGKLVMPRRRVAEKREILPDPIFNSDLVAKFINRVMCSGKKSIAEKIVYGALTVVAERKTGKKVQITDLMVKDDKEGDSEGSATGKLKGSILELFEKALDNVRPTVEVRARRVGGSTYQIPVEVRPSRRNALAMRWIVEGAQARGEKSMVIKLANEILDAIEGKGSAVKKRETMHSMAKANLAFAHFSWK